jgi:hypothetical protein
MVWVRATCIVLSALCRRIAGNLEIYEGEGEIYKEYLAPAATLATTENTKQWRTYDSPNIGVVLFVFLDDYDVGQYFVMGSSKKLTERDAGWFREQFSPRSP